MFIKVSFLLYSDSNSADWFLFTTLAISTLALILFGEVSFEKLKMTGPYQVGFREFKTDDLNNAVSVFYPMDREIYDQQIKLNNTPWLRNGSKTLLGIAKAGHDYGTEDHPSMLFFRHMRKINMDTVYFGDISKDFTETSRPLIPIIFSHGMCSNRTMHSGTCRDLASHGYIVFALDHNDRTSSYI